MISFVHDRMNTASHIENTQVNQKHEVIVVDAEDEVGDGRPIAGMVGASGAEGVVVGTPSYQLGSESRPPIIVEAEGWQTRFTPYESYRLSKGNEAIKIE